MGIVRELTASDLGGVGALHRRAFPGASPGRVDAQFRQVFLDGPWSDPACPSLVYEDHRGSIAGFLGVVARRMAFDGRPLRVATSSQFMVDRECSGLAAVALLKRFVSGPQDLSVADEASEASRAVWQALGGDLSRLHGLRWIRVLRPSRFALLVSLRGRTHLLRRRLAAPLCDVGDAVATRLPGSPFRRERPRPPDGSTPDLSLQPWLDVLAATAGALRPIYDEPALEWLLGMLERKRCHGRLRQRLVRGDQGQTLGAYLFYVKRGATAEVAYFGARPEQFEHVWDRMLDDAWHHGAVALSGRLDPRYIDELSSRRCIFNRGFGSFLFQTRLSGLRDAIHRGVAAFSRLDGEWWMRFLDEPEAAADDPVPRSAPLRAVRQSSTL